MVILELLRYWLLIVFVGIVAATHPLWISAHCLQDPEDFVNKIEKGHEFLRQELETNDFVIRREQSVKSNEKNEAGLTWKVKRYTSNPVDLNLFEHRGKSIFMTQLSFAQIICDDCKKLPFAAFVLFVGYSPSTLAMAQVLESDYESVVVSSFSEHHNLALKLSNKPYGLTRKMSYPGVEQVCITKGKGKFAVGYVSTLAGGKIQKYNLQLSNPTYHAFLDSNKLIENSGSYGFLSLVKVAAKDKEDFTTFDLPLDLGIPLKDFIAEEFIASKTITQKPNGELLLNMNCHWDHPNNQRQYENVTILFRKFDYLLPVEINTITSPQVNRMKEFVI